MKLTRLELAGFKSFADTADLRFYEGVTAVVGPNGCGKSNISDAVRWVLGEQRARLLRSARMDEIIFQGSIKRKPINLAEVSLVFDNSDGALPIAYREVVVTRRITRTGQSEYLINQAPVRLRDVSDLLQGTGLGSDAGVVIEAQMIDRLLSDRTEERRSLFEEAAGIGLYRNRKEATERRLERTTVDLQRLDDVISEVQTQVRSLARQRGRTERHREFTTRRFALAMTLARRDLESFDEQHAALRDRGAFLRNRIPQVRERIEELGATREESLRSRATAASRQTDLTGRMAEARLEVERLEGDLKLAEERLQHVQSRRARAVEERRQAEARIAQLEEERQAATAERAAAVEARASVQTELDLRAASEGEARDRLRHQRETVRRLEEELQQRAETLRGLQGERSALERELEELRQQAAEVAQRSQAGAQQAARAGERVEASRRAVGAAEAEEREAATGLERSRHNLAAAREHETAVRIERREAEERNTQIEARRDALATLERDREGLAPAVQQLLGDLDAFEDGSVLGPISDFVTIDREGAAVAERLLGDWLQAVLVRDESAVEAIRHWHARVTPGPLLLLPVSPGPRHSGHGHVASPSVDVREPARAWVEALLAAGEPGDLEATYIRKANGAVLLPGPMTAGPLTRRAELEDLGRELTEQAARLERLQQELDRATAAHGECERDLESARERLGRARTVTLEARGEFDDAGRAQMRAEREHGEVQQTAARVAERLAEREDRLRRVAEEAQATTADRERLSEDLLAQQSALASLDQEQEAARERRVHWQVEEVQVSAREEAATQREARATQALAATREAIDRLTQELSGIDADTNAASDQRSEWTDRLADRRAAILELEKVVQSSASAVTDADATVDHIEMQLDESRRELEALSEETHRVEIELTEAQGRRQGMIERLEGEWHKPLDTLLAEAEPVDGDTDALRQEAEEIGDSLERIGPVNLLAVEEHAEELKRLDFLTTQRDDLIAARDSLRQALKEIDGTAREMFTETFAAIRENFRSVFLTLFEGGECDVRLADEHDPLSSDIVIHAAPRGKRTQRIHLLSSGERALVAISLLFAIYLTKPAPFCLLDEVDAPLDDANVMRFVRLLDEFKADTQFIVITHNPRTMQVADSVYGVTMQEPGVSTIVGVRLGESEQSVA
jgi:chromosome segregation protein